MNNYFNELKSLALAGTMTATGETREALFKTSGSSSSKYTRFRCGYRGTTNNQSIAQEFDFDGKVHKVIEEHYRSKGKTSASEKVGKCSRSPQDIWTLRGKTYHANPKAKRGALAFAIKRIFGTSNIVAYNVGGNFIYVPDMKVMAHRMGVAARAITGSEFTRR